jgi:GNAT superfamily N-acetyltransferase
VRAVASSLRVVRAEPDLVWHAYDGDDLVGTAGVLIRPDQRCAVFADPARPGADAALLAAVAADLHRDLYAWAAGDDAEALARYQRLGFAEHRREGRYLIPTDPEVTGLRDAPVPDGVTVTSAAGADTDRLRLLDDDLRQDVPGSDGWRWDAEGFRAETFSPAFDPATYLVAVDAASGGYAGLARVWANQAGPRLGLIAVLPPYRRRGLARALLGQAFGVLHERGQASVTAEVDDTNIASVTLLTSLGARRTGSEVELLRPADGPVAGPGPGR